MKATFLLLISLLLPALAQAQNTVEKKILIMGDSLSAGYGIEVNQGWVELSRIQLKESHPEVTLVNASISGETAKGGARRLPLMINIHKPDIILLELGANDGLRGFSIDSITKELTKMIELALDKNIQVVILGIQLPPNLGDDYNHAFAAQYQILADTYTLPILPFLLEGVALNNNWMQNDGLHPNALGQATIKDNVLGVLTPLLSVK